MLRKLEKYEVEEEIGHGGMATVYRAHDTVLDRLVALKVMHPHLRAAEEARRRFQREARSVARLRHPRVLEIYDFSGEASEEAYIAAELLTGPTLKQWREKQQDVPAEVAACFVIEIARALEAAHAAGIIHRDVKPENVLLHEARTLKLTDFGIADMVDSQSMTATGQILGSPGHMAPEQIEGRDTDERSDLFSLGTVLYYLATGRLPFTGRNPHQVLKRIMDAEFADPLRVNPAIGGRLRAIILKSLEREPQARYQDAAELREALEAFVAEAGITDPEQTLARYLADPDEVAAELRAQTVELLIEHGARASDVGDVPLALDYYNRVLALDEGNERVLRLIERVGMDRRRRMMMTVGVGLLAFGAVAGGAAWALWPDPSVSPGGPGSGRATQHAVGPLALPVGGADAGALREADAGSPERQEAADAGSVRGAGGAAGDAVAAAGADSDGDTAARRPDPAQDTQRPRRSASDPEGGATARGPRTVRFVSPQQDLEIGVDGADPRPIWQVRTVELTPGRHRIQVRPGPRARSLYEERTLQVRVPPGHDELEVPVSLPLISARLFVRSAVAGEVDVAGRVQGRTNEVIFVPMRSAQENLRVRVRAEGHRDFRTLQRLEAGGDTQELEATLRPEAAADEGG